MDIATHYYQTVYEHLEHPTSPKTIAAFQNPEISSDFVHLLEELLQKKNYGVILNEPIFLPYLSIMDNLFIRSSLRKKAQKDTLREWNEFFQLPEKTFSESFDQLSTFEQLKLQLLQMLLSGKEKLVLAIDLSTLTVFEKQQLLPLLNTLSEKKAVTICIITNDYKILDSPYVDVVY